MYLTRVGAKCVLQMVDVDSWSMHVRSITGHVELQVAVREFERNVERAVQMEQRAHQTHVKVQLTLVTSQYFRIHVCMLLAIMCWTAVMRYGLTQGFGVAEREAQAKGVRIFCNRDDAEHNQRHLNAAQREQA